MSGHQEAPASAEAPPARSNPGAKAARLLNRTFPQAYAIVSLIPRLVAARVWLAKLERAGSGRRLTELSIGQHRRSDTVFVFGTGASLNNYPAEYWEVIRKHDSIGMNFFMLHEHVPTFHVMEDVGGIRTQILTERYLRRGDYAATPLILKTQLTNLSADRVSSRLENMAQLPDEIRARAYLSLDLLAAGKTISGMEAAYRLTSRLGLWKPKDKFLMLTKRRGSVSYVINLAARAGYRRIVLCGVDLNHTEFFYDSRRTELEARGLPVPENDENGRVHSTNDPTNHPITIHSVLLAIKEHVLDPAGIELSVGSVTSALYPDLPCFDWDSAAH